MYIRVKKIKGNDYVYSVKNKWTKKGPRQISKKYIGRLYFLEDNNDISFDDLNFINAYSHKEILREVFKKTLENYGFSLKNGKMVKENFVGSILQFRLSKNKKEVVLKSKEGFLSGYLLKKILKYVPKRKSFEEDSLEFTKLIVNSGLLLSKEAFVEWFRKVYNN